MKTLKKLFAALVAFQLFSLSAFQLSAQPTQPIRKATVSDEIAILSAADFIAAAGSTTTISGTFTGSPTGGTLNLENLTLSGEWTFDGITTAAGLITSGTVRAGTELIIGASGDNANDIVIDSTGIKFEGATADGFETYLRPNDPTADTVLYLPTGAAHDGIRLATMTDVTDGDSTVNSRVATLIDDPSQDSDFNDTEWRDDLSIWTITETDAAISSAVSSFAETPGTIGDFNVANWHTELNIEDAAAADQTAAEVVSTATGDIAATTVQAALAELAGEKATAASVTALDTAKQDADPDLTDLADGELSGSKIGFGINAANISNGLLDPDRLAPGGTTNQLVRIASDGNYEHVTLSAGGGDLDTADIDTIVELNNIFTDGTTLVDGGADQSALAARAPRQGVTSDGTSSLAEAPIAPTVSTGDFSIGFTIALDDVADGTARTIVGNAGTGTSGVDNSWRIFVSGNASNGLGLRLRDSSSTSLIAYSGELNVGDRESLSGVVTVDKSGNATWYILGVQSGTPLDVSSQSGEHYDSAQTLSFYETLNGNTAAGVLNQFFMVDRVLTSDEVTLIHSRATPLGIVAKSDLYQHLIPTPDWLAAGILEDVSGNNKHTALGGIPGENGIDTIIPVKLPHSHNEEPALRSDGSTDARIYSTTNNQSPGTGDFSVLWRGIFPTDGGGSARTLVALTDSISTVNSGGGLWMAYNTSRGLVVYLFAASGADYLTFESTELQERLAELGAAGEIVSLLFVRDSTTPKMFLAVGKASPIEITNLFNHGTGGTPPAAWSDSVSADYLVGFYRSSSINSDQTLHRVRLYNAAANLAEAADAMSPTPRLDKFKGQGDNTELITNGTFESDVTGWSTTASATASYETSSPITGSGSMSLDFAAAGHYAYQDITTVVGQTYRMQVTAEDVGLTGGKTIGFSVSSTGGGAIDFNTTNPITAATAYEFEWVAARTTSRIRVTAQTGITGEMLIDDFSIIALGQTVGLSLEDGGGFQPKNPASTWNDSTNWTMSTSGITHTIPAPLGGTITLNATLDETDISTSTGTTSLGTIPQGWAVLRIDCDPSEAFDASTTFDVGTSGDSDLYGTTLDLATTSPVYEASNDLAPVAADTEIYVTKNQATTTGNTPLTVTLQRIF